MSERRNNYKGLVAVYEEREALSAVMAQRAKSAETRALALAEQSKWRSLAAQQTTREIAQERASK